MWLAKASNPQPGATSAAQVAKRPDGKQELLGGRSLLLRHCIFKNGPLFQVGAVKPVHKERKAMVWKPSVHKSSPGWTQVSCVQSLRSDREVDMRIL